MNERDQPEQPWTTSALERTFVNTSSPALSSDQRLSVRKYTASWSRRLSRRESRGRSKHPSYDRSPATLLSPPQSVSPDGIRQRSESLRRDDEFVNQIRILLTNQVDDEYHSAQKDVPASPPKAPLNPGVGNELMDPFQTLPVHLEAQKALLLKTFSNRVIPKAMFPFSPATVNAYHKWVIPSALREPMVLFAVLSATSQHLFGESDGMHSQSTIRSQYFPGTINSMSMYQRYKSQAIRHLALTIKKSGGVNAITVYTIQVLLRTEILDGCLDGIKAHISGMEQLFALGFDLSLLHPSIVAPTLFHLYLGCAVARCVPPVRPPEITDSVVSHNTRSILRLCPDLALSQIATGFATPSAMQMLGHGLLEQIAQFREHTLIREFSHNGQLKLSLEELEYFAIAEQHSNYSLLVLAGDESILDPILESVRLALLVFFYGRYIPVLTIGHSLQRACRFSDQMWKTLTQTQGDLLDAWAFSHEMLLWVLVLGAHMYRGQAQRPWYIFQLAKVMTCLCTPVRTPDELEIVLGRFFYVKRIYSSSLAEIWAEVSIILEDASYRSDWLGP